MTERKKPGVAFWTTVAVGVPILYVASFGPACWISSHMNFGARAVQLVYWPLTWAMLHIAFIGNALARYAEIGAAEGWSWIVDQDIAWWVHLPPV